MLLALQMSINCVLFICKHHYIILYITFYFYLKFKIIGNISERGNLFINNILFHSKKRIGKERDRNKKTIRRDDFSMNR